MKKSQNLGPPTHRVIIDRRTNQPIGPPVPIHPDDWPYSEIHPSEVLWRYMDLWKFEDILLKSALYFSRPDKFVDPFEGRFSLGNATRISPSDAAFHAAYRLAPYGKELEESQEIMRQVVFVSCWHRANKEKREMWEAYTSGPDSVVISTSAKALGRFVPERIAKSPVKYHADDFPRTEFGHTLLFFYKPRRYGFEREFRMLLTPSEDESISIDEVGRNVSIRLKNVIHRVITHPRATPELKIKIDLLMGRYLKHIRRQDSILLP